MTETHWDPHMLARKREGLTKAQEPFPAIGFTYDAHHKMVRHCERATPNEAVGLLGFAGNRVHYVARGTNWSPTPQTEVTLEARAQYELEMKIADLGLTYGAFYHSHHNQPAEPGEKDINFCPPDQLMVIVRVVDGQYRETRCWHIIGLEPFEVEILPVEEGATPNGQAQ